MPDTQTTNTVDELAALPNEINSPFPAQKPSVSADSVSEFASPLPMPYPVSGRGKMTPYGYVSENDAYHDILTQEMDGKTVGHNPLDIPVEVLTRAGHGPRRTSAVVAAMGDVELVERLRSYKDLKRQCEACVELRKERLDCVIIDCPIWLFRMGKNPHNPRRGTNPFSKKEAL